MIDRITFCLGTILFTLASAFHHFTHIYSSLSIYFLFSFFLLLLLLLSEDLCEKKDCPKCETVCSPANCRTQCEAPNAVCTPMCEATKCDWKCKKPITCPKPKCELVCERPACDTRARKTGTKGGCCSCANQANLAATIRAANSLVEESSEISAMMPSFMEVMHTIKAQTQEGKGMCCKCAA